MQCSMLQGLGLYTTPTLRYSITPQFLRFDPIIFNYGIGQELVAHLLDPRLAEIVHLHLDQLPDPHLANLVIPQLLQRLGDCPARGIEEGWLEGDVDADGGHVPPVYWKCRTADLPVRLRIADPRSATVCR